MSTGHREEQETAQGQLDYREAGSAPRFLNVLRRPLRVSTDYDIPYIGGYSEDGSTIYIDRDFARVKWRVGYDAFTPDRFVVTHENWEKTAMMVYGWRYLRAHDLATIAEHIEVRRDGRLDPKREYEPGLRPLIETAARKLRRVVGDRLLVRPGVVLPPDLDRAPYTARV